MSTFLRLRHANAGQPTLGDLRRTMLQEQRHADAQLEAFVNGLPRLGEADLATLGESDSHCPICLNPLLTLLAEEELALALDSPAHPPEELGVTRLIDSCKHIFCRKDIRNWVREGKSTCPTCRRPVLPPPSPSSTSRAPFDSPATLDFDEPLRRIADLLAELGSPERDMGDRASAVGESRNGFEGMYS
ncbi:hypothetical protein POSPLADRAFT_1040810 [Postia placenta MAD-698-R-SB12]|uniref:RING-type domain-containing protein n=1 Tax=Postia placenta MAD-698-R-SB12 TaxID=670580 RepID=A0A1X6MU03_9APHY|nr:hypothetical protein POSPLADRAFT_1040810 [Postia placenta MAD-698-R-SB12]OSX59871.1 hypothetical protein POSPLADRAFT_1040810 [Postia placenta MAD-698-R-SB12]